MGRLIQFELRKIFSRRLTQFFLLALFLVSVLFMLSTYQNKYAFDGISREGSGREAVEIDKSIAEKYRGPLTDEKVRQMLADFHTESDINAKYLYRNAMQSAVCARFSDIDGNWNGQTVSDVFGDAEINVGYVDGWLGVSQDMVRVFVFLSLVIIIMIAPVFSGEYGGVVHIILSSKYGKTKCAAAKIIAGFAAAIIVTLWILGINIFMAFVLYGNEGLDCSILFAPVFFTEGYIPFNITCGTLLKYQCLLVFTGTISVAAMTLIFSALSKNQMTTLAFSAAAYLFPAMLPISETSPLFRFAVLFPLYHAQFVSIMSVEQMSSGLLYSIWAVPVAFVLMFLSGIFSRRIFAKHQVSE